MSTLSPEQDLVADCLSDLRSATHGAKMASRIRHKKASAMSEGVMTALLTYDALAFLGVSVGIAPQLKIATRTDSDTGLKQLSNDSSVVRTRPCGKCYSYLRDVCHGTLLHAPCVDPCFEPGKTQRADGLTKILGRDLQIGFHV